MKFGYLALRKDIESELFSIKTNANLVLYDEIEKSWPSVENGWIYSPWINDNRNCYNRPLKPSVVFPLPSSHEIYLKSEYIDSDIKEQYERYMILVFGFLNGIHLLPENYVHFHRTAIKPGTLVGFELNKADERRMLEIIYIDYQDTPDELKNYKYSLVHWFLASQEYSAQHDRFINQYMVTDAAYNLFLKI